MPMIMYTEEELIDGQNLAVADALREIHPRLDRAMTENTELRKRLNDLRDGAEMMLRNEDAGGNGWWSGWGMIKAALAREPKSEQAA